MDDKSTALNDDDGGLLFPETETRRVAERFAPRPADVEAFAQRRAAEQMNLSIATPRAVAVEGVRAIEEALRRPPAPEARHLLLAAREPTHGNFEVTALIAQRFKDAARNTPNWGSKLTDVQREALEGVFTKIARILSGDPNHKDHWSDIGGAAHLVEERL
jgi:hypothetical protein